MKICVIGVTGLLGFAGAEELIARGHSIVGVALPPLPRDFAVPKNTELKLGNYLKMSDSELRACFKGCEGFVFAAGIDERVEGAPPIYDLFKKYNIDALQRLLDIAKTSGVKKVVILGSYFSHFAKIWQDLELAKHHPYIRSRIEQEQMAFSYANNETKNATANETQNKSEAGMDIAVLELPYIFGAQKGRKPVWLFIAEMIKNTKGRTLFYPKGGTTMVTVRQVGECIAGALERTVGAKAYPVGWYNMTWKTWLEKFSRDMGMPKRVFTIPNFLFRFAARFIARDIKKRGKESGLEIVEFSKIMTANTFIDKDIIEKELGVHEDNIDQAIKSSAEACLEILNNPEKPILDMKPE